MLGCQELQGWKWLGYYICVLTCLLRLGIYRLKVQTPGVEEALGCRRLCFWLRS